MIAVTLGVDIGTGSSKGVLVTFEGVIVATATVQHSVATPSPGFFEMDAAVWWEEFCLISRECLLGASDKYEVVAVGVSGMGPCVAIADKAGLPLRPAILYGIDCRAVEQIERLNEQLGREVILDRTGSTLSTQAVGPKLLWLADNEPELFAVAQKLFMPSSWLVFQLTGEYVLDHHSASQCNPMYDRREKAWIADWSATIAPNLELPQLRWPGEQAGSLSAAAAGATGLPAGIPVITGTVDAWAEAVSVDAQKVGDLMLMYGSTMFLVNTVDAPITVDTLWGTNGAYEGTHSLAGGMATSGSITAWLRELVGSVPYPQLLDEARAAGPGAGGLLMLPYFAGERTPIADPGARGVIIGLTTSTTRGQLYRAALEAIALGIRHNVDTFLAAGAQIDHIIAVGGGTQGDLWTQVVSDVTGLSQVVPTTTIGASYGAAYLAAKLLADVHIADWNPPASTTTPDPALRAGYDELYAQYRAAYPATRAIVSGLAGIHFP